MARGLPRGFLLSGRRRAIEHVIDEKTEAEDSAEGADVTHGADDHSEGAGAGFLHS